MDQATVSQAPCHPAARAAMLSAVALLAGCAAQAAPPTPPDADLMRAIPVSETGTLQPAPPAAELVQPDDPEIQAAMRAWKSGPPAPIIRATDFVPYPYGLTEAIVRCEPFRVCNVELDTGEEVRKVSIGDTSRWLLQPVFSAALEGLTPHVMFEAVRVPHRHQRHHHDEPEDLLPRPSLQGQERPRLRPAREVLLLARPRRAGEPDVSREALAGATRIGCDRGPRARAERLSFGYEIVGGQGLAWRPVHVFDDGQHIYIRVPAALRASEAAALLVRSRGGESALVNYQVRLPYYVVDRLFDAAVMIVGVGRQQDRVMICRTRNAQ
jgi:type IV secretion system protein TrbG